MLFSAAHFLLFLGLAQAESLGGVPTVSADVSLVATPIRKASAHRFSRTGAGVLNAHSDEINGAKNHKDDDDDDENANFTMMGSGATKDGSNAHRSSNDGTVFARGNPDAPSGAAAFDFKRGGGGGGKAVLKVTEENGDGKYPVSWPGPFGSGNRGSTSAMAPVTGPRVAVIAGRGEFRVGFVQYSGRSGRVYGAIVAARTGFGPYGGAGKKKTDDDSDDDEGRRGSDKLRSLSSTSTSATSSSSSDFSPDTTGYIYASGALLGGGVSLAGSGSNSGGRIDWQVEAPNSILGGAALLYDPTAADQRPPEIAVSLFGIGEIASVNLTTGQVISKSSVHDLLGKNEVQTGTLRSSSVSSSAASGFACGVATTGDAGAVVVGYAMGMESDSTHGIAWIEVSSAGVLGKAKWNVETLGGEHKAYDAALGGPCTDATVPGQGGNALWVIGRGSVAALSVADGSTLYAGPASPAARSVSVAEPSGQGFYQLPTDNDKPDKILIGATDAAVGNVPRVVAEIDIATVGRSNVTAPVALIPDGVGGGVSAIVVATGTCVQKFPVAGDNGDAEGGNNYKAAPPAPTWTHCVPAFQRRFMGDSVYDPVFLGLAVDGRGTVFATGCGTLTATALDGATGDRLWSLWDTSNNALLSSPPAIAPDGTLVSATQEQGYFHAVPGSWTPQPVGKVGILASDAGVVTVTIRPHDLTDWFACVFDVKVTLGDDLHSAGTTVDPNDASALSPYDFGWIAQFPGFAAGLSGEIVAQVKRVCKPDGAESGFVSASLTVHNGGDPSGSPNVNPNGHNGGGGGGGVMNWTLLAIIAGSAAGALVITAAVAIGLASRARRRREMNYPRLVQA